MPPVIGPSMVGIIGDWCPLVEAITTGKSQNKAKGFMANTKGTNPAIVKEEEEEEEDNIT